MDPSIACFGLHCVLYKLSLASLFALNGYTFNTSLVLPVEIKGYINNLGVFELILIHVVHMNQSFNC